MKGQPRLMKGQPNFLEGQPKLMKGQPRLMKGQPNFLEGRRKLMKGQPNFCTKFHSHEWCTTERKPGRITRLIPWGRARNPWFPFTWLGWQTTGWLAIASQPVVCQPSHVNGNHGFRARPHGINLVILPGFLSVVHHSWLWNFVQKLG